MATITKFDELNIVASDVATVNDRHPIPIDEFFDEMDLDDEEKAKRKDLAKSIYDILFFILTFIKATEVSGGTHDVAYYVDYIKRNLGETYQQFFGDDRYQDRVDSLAEQLINTTMNHIGSSYYTSSDRATVDAETETNIVCGDDLFNQAVSNGYTMKKWVTMHDKRVRHTHSIIDGEIIPIMDCFDVGTSEMLYPCDPNGSAKEIVNCRCVCKYLNKEKRYGSDKTDNLVGTPISSGWIYEINKNTGRPMESAFRKENCVNTVVAYDMCKKGERCVASIYSYDGNPSLLWNTHFEEPLELTFLDALRVEEKDARYFIGYETKSGFNHAIICEVENYKMEFIDVQKSIKYNMDEFKTLVNGNSINYFRIDDKELISFAKTLVER